jgi:hypothetical protein
MDVGGTLAFAEVEYFFWLQFGDMVHSLALVSMFSPPDQDLLKLSHHAAYICQHGGINVLTVVDVKSITAVVSMVPDYQVTVEGDIAVPDNRFSLVEALFLKLAGLRGTQCEDDDAIDGANDAGE